MTDFIYKVLVEDNEVYWVEDPAEILYQFGTVTEVTRYLLTDPEDVTDEINGEYYRD